MQKFNFATKTADIENLKPHQILVDFELDFQPNEYFADVLKKYGLYEKPVLDLDGNAITHYAEIMAAKANGLKQMEVYEVDMNEIELKLFILTKHTYNIRKVARSYDIACFYRHYLEENTEGKTLAKTIKGDINNKIAYLMGTSSSSIKRLFYIADCENGMMYINRIDNGNLSLHEARGLANKDKNTKEEGDDFKEDNSNDLKSADTQNPEIETESKSKTIELPKPVLPIQVSNNSIVIDDRNVEFGSDEDGTPYIAIDGKKLEDVRTTEIVHRESEVNGKVKSLIFTERQSDGVSIQITIENISKAA